MCVCECESGSVSWLLSMLTVQPKVNGVLATIISALLCRLLAQPVPLPRTTLLILQAPESDGFTLQTTLNSLPPGPRATLNVGLTHAIVACPPPKVRGRQFPWKPPVEVFFFFFSSRLSWGLCLVSISCHWKTGRESVCLCVCVSVCFYAFTWVYIWCVWVW